MGIETNPVTNGSPFILAKHRRSLLRAPRNLEEVTEMGVAAWKKVISKVQVSGATPETIAAMLAQVRDLQVKEQDLVVQLRAAKDARRAASDKTYRELEGADHYLRPAGPAGAPRDDPRERVAAEVIVPWLRERWPL